MNLNKNSAEQQERLNHLLNALGECIHNIPRIREDRRKYLVRFLSILDKCPHAIPPNADGKELVKQLEDGARALKEVFPHYVPFEPVPMPKDKSEAEESKERVCFELYLLLLEKHPQAIEAGIGGDGLVRLIKEGAAALDTYLTARSEL